jgi:hypothetical protein
MTRGKLLAETSQLPIGKSILAVKPGKRRLEVVS